MQLGQQCLQDAARGRVLYATLYDLVAHFCQNFISAMNYFHQTRYHLDCGMLEVRTHCQHLDGHACFPCGDRAKVQNLRFQSIGKFGEEGLELRRKHLNSLHVPHSNLPVYFLGVCEFAANLIDFSL